MHRVTEERWTERRELVSDDLDVLFWSKLRPRGAFAGSGAVSCEWADHPEQSHKIIREPMGGINPYRARFGVREPMRFQSSVGNMIDEVERYRAFRERPDTPPARDSLNIVLTGELAYNAERVLALEERGHRLFGLWMPEPQWFNTVGPVPFGHVEDLPRRGWREALRALPSAMIYALLNWQAVPFAAEVLRANPGIPFVWHFKEGPTVALEKGFWPDLVELMTRADGIIYSTPEMRDWFDTALPQHAQRVPSLVLDGDLPKREWLDACPSPRLSQSDGAFHTVVPGRPIGLHPQTVGELAAQDIHLHFYGDFTHGQWRQWIADSQALAPRHLHLHANVGPEGWVREFSQYDAGWLHYFASENAGDIRRATWDDLNYPARISTLVAAGLPLLQYDNRGATVAMQSLARDAGIGIFFRDMRELRVQLADRAAMDTMRANVWRARDHFTFDSHADELIAFFRRVIATTGAVSAGAK
jgi:hypothetical protein